MSEVLAVEAAGVTESFGSASAVDHVSIRVAPAVVVLQIDGSRAAMGRFVA